MPPQNVYARLLLLSAGRGYPLWTPEPSNELLMQRPEGLAIGDVGVVLDDGGFDVFFNICLPPDHPFHLRHGVPQGFNCIHPSELDIRTIVDAEPPGHIISSSSIMRQTFGSSSDASKRHDLDALPYVFNLSSSEGALLVLPKGAERCDLLNEDLFLEQATRHAADWYNYAVNRRRRIINPDSLYLITGIHKTFAWSVAAFENATGNDHTAHFKQVEGNDTPMYRWETTTCSLDWRVGPRINYDIPNQSVFIRGFKIAIRSGFLGTRRVRVEADVPSIRSDHVKWKGSNSSVRGGLGGLMGLFSSSTGNNVFPTGMRSERTVNAAEERLQRHEGTQVEIQRIPGVVLPFHPLDAINRYLLDKNPSANIAITHDSHWISLLENDKLTQDFWHESFLDTVLCQNYHTVSREGVVFIVKQISQSMGRSGSGITMPQLSASHAQILEEDVDPPFVWDSEMTQDYGAGVDYESGPFPPFHYPNSAIQSWQHITEPGAGIDYDFFFYPNPSIQSRHITEPGVACATAFSAGSAQEAHVHHNSLNTGQLESGPVDNVYPTNNLSVPDFPVLASPVCTTRSRKLLDPSNEVICPCLWTVDDAVCGTLLVGDTESIKCHLRDVHYIKSGTAMIQCAWRGCLMSMRPENIPRHIFTQHLGIRWSCPFCSTTYSREDACNRHLRVCSNRPAVTGPTDGEVRRGTTGPDGAQVGRKGRRTRYQ